MADEQATAADGTADEAGASDAQAPEPAVEPAVDPVAEDPAANLPDVEPPDETDDPPVVSPTAAIMRNRLPDDASPAQQAAMDRLRMMLGELRAAFGQMADLDMPEPWASFINSMRSFFDAP